MKDPDSMGVSGVISMTPVRTVIGSRAETASLSGLEMMRRGGGSPPGMLSSRKPCASTSVKETE